MGNIFCCDCQSVVKQNGPTFDDVQVKHAIIVHDGQWSRLVPARRIRMRWVAVEGEFWDMRQQQ